MTFIAIMLAGATIFVVYAVVTHYSATEAGQPIAKRVFAAVIAAAAAFVTAVAAWLTGLGTGG
jgi:hypothetical protein